MKRWLIFVRERFDPLSHAAMIALFIVAHYVAAATIAGLSGPRALVDGAWPAHAFVAVGVTAFFFKLRLYDEIKDYELDCTINPSRPLVRGLVTHGDLHRGIAVCIAIELVAFGLHGSAGLISILCAVGYSLLMYKEFFIRERIRPYLTTYAVTHTVVCAMLSLALFALLLDTKPWELGREPWLFALACWCLFNVFEFGRKTFTSAEEREGVESYSKIWGRVGAVLLVLSQAAIATWALLSSFAAGVPGIAPAMVGMTLTLVLTGVAYRVTDRPPWGSVYRGMSSFYIVLVFSSVVILGTITLH